jgi:lysophospholipase L1-like esterase
LLAGAAGIAAMVAAAAAWAGTIVGAPRGDVLRGSPRSDKIYGRAGNDRLYGYGGNDLLVGGPGADLLACGSGRDVATADAKDTVRLDCEVVRGRPKASPPPPAPSGDRVYVALGDSISAGVGSSSLSKGWVTLYFGYLASIGSVTKVHNLAIPGYTTTTLRRLAVPRAVSVIDGPHDTVRVTVNIGGNDLCDSANAPECPIGGNLRAILTTLNEALARDPGDESIQIMEMYNPSVGLARERASRTYLLGSDLRVDCSGAGNAIGLNDLLRCIALQNNAVPVDVLPVFDAAGARFLAEDHLHPNDAGHRAIAEAFGGSRGLADAGASEARMPRRPAPGQQ